ncbi:MAG: adenosylcobinamide-GDP ribazoletransferase [Isosphaeraceae bacterium]|nr:adenosylcobinamide-GDP ribazoletransferase [Isosphaeraceae bacterium]
MNSSPPEPDKSPAERAAVAVALAFAFLTVIPTWPLSRKISDQDVEASRFAFPLVGVVLGLVLAILSGLFERSGIAPPVAAFLLVAATAAVTGGLHLDGLADTADGLFLWGESSRRLTVMRDPHVGSYGVTAVVLCVLGKFVALASLPGSVRGLGLFTALTVSRSLILVSAGRASYARAEGTGRLLINATTPSEALAAAALALLVASLTNHVAGLFATLVALGITLGTTELAKRRLGGVTGDILGALTELSEMSYLVSLSCFF